MISAIFAISQNNVIGYNNSLPWHIQDDLKRFKELTWGKKIVMGRKTWESLPKKPLPNRQHYVLTRDRYFIEDWANSKEKREQFHILGGLDNLNALFPKNEEVFIIGGGEVFREAFDLQIIDKVYVTGIHHDIIGDTYLNWWNKYSEKFYPHTVKTGLSHGNMNYTFSVWKELS